MVARPPLRVRIEPMTLDDIADVHDIERASFPVPWPTYAFRQELETNRLAHYLVVRAGDQTVAYAGVWLMVDEAHITTFAVLPEWRRRGIGARLMLAVLRLSIELKASVATLEVRLSNVAARMLYGLWRIWHAWHTTGHDSSWLASAGIAGSMSVGAVVLGHYVTYFAGVLWRLRL